MKKYILGFFIGAVVFTGVSISLADQIKLPSGEPFLALQNAIDQLWVAVNNIQLLPGPKGDKGDKGDQGEKGNPGEPSWDENRIQNLESRLTELENLLNKAIIIDNFNSYTDGSIDGQGSWNSYANGQNFVIQGATVFEGMKALYNNTVGDSVIMKSGNPISDGKQSFHIRTENRNNYGSYPNGNVQIRLLKGSWGGSAELRNFVAVSFKSDGNVAYYDGTYQNFATYNDNEWTLLEIEWRSSDKTARYKINNGAWTDWHVISGSGTFTDFDNVGFDFVLPSGSGGVYFDTLGN